MKKDHVLDHKTNFSKFKRTETIQSILSVHNGIKLEITNKYSWKKISKYLEIKQHIFNTHVKVSGQIKNTLN